jgi:hypothetical protein
MIKLIIYQGMDIIRYKNFNQFSEFSIKMVRLNVPSEALIIK